MTSEITLSEPVRTAIGAYNGALTGVPATALGARASCGRRFAAPASMGRVSAPS